MEDLCGASLTVVCTWIHCTNVIYEGMWQLLQSANPSSPALRVWKWLRLDSSKQHARNAAIIATSKEEDFSQYPLLVRGWFALWGIGVCKEPRVFTLSLISYIDLSLNQCCNTQGRSCSFKKEIKILCPLNLWVVWWRGHRLTGRKKKNS